MNIADASSLNYGLSVNHTAFSPLATYAATTTHASNCTPGNGYSTCKIQSGFVPTNVWINETFTYDGVTQRIYINGVQIQSSTINKGAIDKCVGGQLLLGMYCNTTTLYLSGKMDEIMMYNRALSPSEVQQRQNSILTPTNETGLIAYYRFEEGSGTQAIDLSGNNNHGTLFNCTYSTDVPFSSALTTNLNLKGNQYFCENDSLLLQAPLKSTFKYSWFLNGAAMSGATSRSIYAKVTGNYYCVITDTSGGCQKNSDTANVVLYAAPAAPVITGSTNLSGGKTTETYTNLNSAGATHLWSVTNGTILSGQGTSAITVQWNTSGTGPLSLQVSYINGCKTSKAWIITRSVGLNNKQADLELNVYPVPTRDILILEMNESGNSFIEISNILGEKILTEPISGKLELDMSLLAPGTYFIKAYDASGSVTKKFVKL